jgi:hypothetical protein
MKKYQLFLFISIVIRSFAQTDHWETAVYENNVWSYVVPSVEPDTNWRKTSFNASSWATGPGGFGFGDSDDNTIISTNTSVYIRIAFNITDTSKISAAILNADYDDGFVAYLNNVEIARANISTPGRPPYNTLASANHEAAMYSGGTPDYFNLSESTLEGIMKNGTNILAIQIHNITTTSSDLSSRFWLNFGIHDVSVFFGPTPSWFNAAVDFTSSNLPIVVINTGGQTILNDPKIIVDMGIINNGPGIRNYLSDPFNEYNGKIGIEYRGNYSASLPQKPYGIETCYPNGISFNVPILGMPPENDWALLATYNDKSFTRNILSNSLFEKMGHYAPRSKFVEVVLNGEYQGIYMFSEVIKKDANRVSIAKLDSTEITWPQISGGYIIKTDYWDATNSWQTSYSPIDHPGYQIHLAYDYPAPDKIVPQQKNYIQNFIYDFETALYGPNFNDTLIGYKKYLSTRSFMDYFYVNELARNVDGYKKSCFYHKEKDDSLSGAIGKLKAGPVWDFDWAWKDIWDCNIFQATDGSGWSHHINDCNTDNYSPGWMIRLLQDSVFANELNCRWQNLRNGILDTSFVFHYIDSVANYLDESQKRHYGYWGHMGSATGTPEIQAPRQSYQAEIDSLKSWIVRRINWMDQNMFGNSINCLFTGINSTNNVITPANVFPNPFKDEIYISIYLERTQKLDLSIHDATGKLVFQMIDVQMNSGENKLNFILPDELNSGTYFLHISEEKHSWVKKIIKMD